LFGYVAKANTFYLAENSSSASISDTTETGYYINTAGYYCNSTGLGLMQKKLSVGSNTFGEIGSLFPKFNEMYIGLNGSKSAKLKDVGNYTLSISLIIFLKSLWMVIVSLVLLKLQSH